MLEILFRIMSKFYKLEFYWWGKENKRLLVTARKIYLRNQSDMLPRTVILDTNCQKSLGFLGSFLRLPAAGSSAPKPLGLYPCVPSTTLPVEKDTNRQKSLGFLGSFLRPPAAGSSDPKPLGLCPEPPA